MYEGRGWGVVGAHAKAHNFDSVGIAFMGNFNGESNNVITFVSTLSIFLFTLDLCIYYDTRRWFCLQMKCPLVRH